MSDKEICQSAKKAGDELKAGLIAAMSSGGEPSPDDFKKALTAMEEKMASLAAAGGDSKVATAMGQFGVEVAKAAAAADPAAAAENPSFEKAAADVTAACKTTGVNVNY